MKLALFKIAEKFRVRTHHHGGLIFEGFLVGFHRASKFKKMRILPIGISIDPKGLRIPCATKLLRLLVRLSQNNFSILFGL
jgi:hypothetical protein